MNNEWVHIGRWCYTKPNLIPDKNGNIIFISKKSFGPLEIYEWGMDRNNIPYELYKWLENDFYEYENYCRSITKEELLQRINRAILIFNRNGLVQWVKTYEKIIETLLENDFIQEDNMTEQEFKAKALELIRTIVNYIADKKYAELALVAEINSSWIKSGQTQEQAFLEFGKWLDEQLAMWEEYEERPFVIDHFDESCLDDIELEDNNTSFTTYNPTNSGEELDIWFEINFKAEENDKITAVFNVNF